MDLSKLPRLSTTASPPPSDDPATLTDGWRHGPGKIWRSAANPGGPREFV